MSQTDRTKDQEHYLIYRHWTTELAGLTKGHAVAHDVVMDYLNRAKAEAIKIRRNEFSSCVNEPEMFQSSNLAFNTQKRVPRGGKHWIH